MCQKIFAKYFEIKQGLRQSSCQNIMADKPAFTAVFSSENISRKPTVTNLVTQLIA
jgi:hypothetical protein